MDFTGKFCSIGRDYVTGKYSIILLIDGDITKTYERLKDKEISVTLKEKKRKRSLDANAYYWQLLSKCAEVLNVSKPYMHNYMLRKHGQMLIINDQAAYVVLPDTPDAEKVIDESETYHLKPTSQVKEGRDGKMYRTYMMLRGSSEYNTQEMSVLIDGLVSEAKALDIETLPPDEIARIKVLWRGHEQKI